MSAPTHPQLPDEVVAPTNWRHLAGSVLALLFAAVLLNLGFARLLSANPDLGNPTYDAFVTQWLRLKEAPDTVETLILGDSAGRHGVDPQVLDTVLGTRSINLCTIGDAGVLNDAWQLEAWLDEHPAPRRVLLIHVYDVWGREIAVPLVSRVPLSWGFWNRMRAPWNTDASGTFDLLAERYIPVLTQDRTIAAIATRPWDPPRWNIHFEDTGFSPIWRANPENYRKDVEGQIWTAQNLDYSISDQARDAIRTIDALAAEHGFEVYLVNAPIAEDLLVSDLFRSYYDAAQSLIDSVVQPLPHVHRVLRAPLTFPAERMENADHIIREATGDYTTKMGEAVLAAERG